MEPNKIIGSTCANVNLTKGSEKRLKLRLCMLARIRGKNKLEGNSIGIIKSELGGSKENYDKLAYDLQDEGLITINNLNGPAPSHGDKLSYSHKAKITDKGDVYLKTELDKLAYLPWAKQLRGIIY
jgi:hypothetical protein